MIKVEVVENENGIRSIYFESNKDDDKDTLDKILEALVGSFPRRGAYVIGAPAETLRVDVKLEP